MTSPSSAKLLVLVTGQWACIKIVGRANFSSSLDFKTLVNMLEQQHYDCFVLDLSDCMLMDSTFLGNLAGFALEVNNPANGNGNCNGNGNGHSAGHPVELLNPNPRIMELLDSLGMTHLFTIIKGTFTPPKNCSSMDVAEMPRPTHDELKTNCARAHEILMALDPANIDRFKDVQLFLSEQQKKNTGS
jgi:anti-sigma B factor antagonist